jgi:hypothetical protein
MCFSSNHTLDSLADLANNPDVLPGIVLSGALDVLQRDVHLENQILVHIVVGSLWKVRGAGDSKRLLSANIDKVYDSSF